MDSIQGSVVFAAYIAQVTGNPLRHVCAQRGMSDSVMCEGISRLNNNNLMDRDKLTSLGRESIRVVLTGGVFDIIHPGHIHTLNAAKSLGNILVVVIATDNTATKMKREVRHSQVQRQTLVESLQVVDVCVIGHQNDIFKTVRTIMPDVIALGYDQIHHEKYISDGCKKINPRIEVARLQSPVPDISSSEIKRAYGDNIYDL
ncbi:MAG: adenylyltransferase/cytidyltransferase family protein [Cenarchaeum sp. SB0661_bin_35]|nr:adenylyltransferase/cytidyltransferase family protein [Cenarchaeum sp. SB0667_bin_13]MXZ92930.1 adenylyltransferase/cytidyltransferase family protein [Cenarchaeum sp. SB0666_bin_15]MYC80347.1 adenylyltransferase/cytidyltransferase family protein [Cenarchaeum sp. SB0661_bin_35]MYI51357.1 adenylyltransferase/cytidyltransferase family protein [Cenarchaeum sp. SB0673_bin_9]MYJ27560.1 adenylyltransferase/cytidyltransferase family protein [Cenarchaeum sp. SB0672_bin_9]